MMVDGLNNIRTVCPYCGVGCGLRVERGADGVHITGDPEHPANRGRLCTKGAALHETLDAERRLLYPQIHGRRVRWDTALDAVASGFRRIIDLHGPEAVAFYVSGQLLTEDYYVANKLMKGFIGCANIDTNSRLCMSSAVAGHVRAFGEDIVPGCYQDAELADLVVLAGSNAAWCHPVLFQRIQDARQRRPGMKLVAIDPRRTQTAASADLHLAIRPGSDVALFNGLLAFLEQAGCVRRDFVEQHTGGADAALAAARAECADPAEVARLCDVDPGDLIRFYRWFAGTERVVTMFSQGINQSSSGTDKVNAIINCHLLTGRIGRPGMGPFSLTGQPNAMGGREVGGLASTLAAHMDFSPENIDRLRRFWNSPCVASRPGLKAVELFKAIGTGRVKAIWIMATNPIVSLPDADVARRALAACELVVISDCVAHTDTTRYAHILLPAAAWGEKDGTVTNSERCISRQRAFLPPPGEAKPDWWIITQVARRLGHYEAFHYEHPSEIFAEHARLSAFENYGQRLFDIGGLANLTQAEYDALEPVQWPVTAANRKGTARLFGGFPAAHGRARFVPVRHQPPAHPPSADFPLVLNSGRVRDHWHTMTRTGKSPRLSSHTGEPFVAVHPDTARTLALGNHTLAEVSTPWGRAVVRARFDTGQRPGEIFMPIHWNDQFATSARVGGLVNPVVDPHSGEPEFKHTPARLRPWPAAWYGFMYTAIATAFGAETGIDYWVKIRELGCWRFELAGREPHRRCASWARRLLSMARAGADWLEYSDPHAGYYRAACVASDQLVACLFIAPAPEALPPRHWLSKLFQQQRLSDADRAGLLAGRAPGISDPGATVCACYGIGRNTLLKAIREQGLCTTAALGQRLKAGTNCGACLPEIRSLIAMASPA